MRPQIVTAATVHAVGDGLRGACLTAGGRVASSSGGSSGGPLATPDTARRPDRILRLVCTLDFA
jgi:hypothetical protein